VSKIRILSEHLANQIAAGEVVERPASVVKELVENSLDAGATVVAVQVEGSGTRLIRVVDNGEGMDEDDVLLSLERHATSKLREDSALDAITTLGFRGEALPSIGSVSRLTLLSRPAGKVTGTRAEIRHGALHAVHEAGCPQGTVVEVRSLFGNVPARKKFLKSARTELYHIEEVLRNQSLAHVGTAFTLQSENRMVLDLPARDSLESRVKDIFPNLDTWLTLAAPASGNDGVGLRGVLFQPDAASTRSNRLRILVNGRPVQDRMIRHAVTEGLQGFLMRGQSPIGVLLLAIDPDQVDVNVHPAKQEIRFRRSQDVHRLIVRSVTAAARKYQEQARSALFTVPEKSWDAPVRTAPPRSDGGSQPARATPGHPQEPPSFRNMFHGGRTAEPAPVFQPAAPGRDGSGDFPKGPDGDVAIAGLTLIGGLSDLYLLCEKDGQLVVIDQHAAHERILYQQLRNSYLQQQVPRQRLMFPLSLELTAGQADAMEEHGAELDLLGFSIEHFGGETWVVKSVPALMQHVDSQELVIEALDRLAEGSGREQTGAIPSRIDHLLATMACKAAVKAGNRLVPREMLELLARMQETDVFSHCPHGRPVFRVFSQREIAQWFKRS